MRRNRILGLAYSLAGLLPCLLFGPGAAIAAQDEGPSEIVNPFEVGVFGGLHFYEKDHGLGRTIQSPTGISPDTGGAFGLRLSYNLNKWIGAEAEGMISPTRTRDNSTSENIIGYRAQVIGTFLHSGYVRPFAVLGWGAFSSFPGNTNIVPRDTDDMFHFGVGAKFPITDMLGLRLDGRIMVPPAIASGIATVGTETHFGGPDYEILLTAYLGFGGEKPVSLPPPPPPALPPPPEPTAPPPPPPAPAPVVDKDTDGDGIPDSIDKCPNEPETFNGYQDEDGCPDEVPAIKKFTGVIKGINFKTKSAEITKDSHDVLDNAVQVLKDFPDVKLEIGGHTDNVGKAEFNLELSRTRAESVKAYLVEKGIAADRLTAVGYGMDKPIEPNKTAVGRAKNRRTEFTLVGGAAK